MSQPQLSSDPAGLPLRVSYLEEADLQTGSSAILAVVGFGGGSAQAVPADRPFALVDMPVLDGPPLYEVWTADAPIASGLMEGLRGAWTPDLFFGCLQISDTTTRFEQIAYDAYDRVFQVLERTGYHHILRVWNYFPHITAADGAFDRYRHFNLGRHQAFVDHDRAVRMAPAACAVGSRSGPLTILFLASRTDGIPIENPRQISAYHYPERYGPRSPTFSRALLAGRDGDAQLFISGTASIVGHESLHRDDPVGQVEEAMANVHALLAEARKKGLARDRRLVLKTYLRDANSLSLVRDGILRAIAPEDRVVFLQGDLCREELLLEIEGVSV